MSMSDILAALLLLLVPLRHSKADRKMAKDTFALIQDYYHLTSIIIIILLLLLLLLLKLSHDMYKQYHNLCLLPLITATCTCVLMTSPAVCFLDHSSSKASSVLLISMSSIVAGQNTATVPSLSSVSMSSSKVFHSSTLALSSSSFVALSSGMAKELIKYTRIAVRVV